MDKVIIGLGNPGRRFKNTRHNLGFMVIDKLAGIYNIKMNKKGFDAIWGEGEIGGEKVFLAKPQTFMNLSGKAVNSILKGLKVNHSNLLILHDDMDLGLSRIRIRQGGGSGGHKGVKSVIDTLGTDQFIRIRIGIGRPIGGDAEDYVLSGFSGAELPRVTETILRASQAVVAVIKEGVATAMNKYNLSQ